MEKIQQKGDLVLSPRGCEGEGEGEGRGEGGGDRVRERRRVKS